MKQKYKVLMLGLMLVTAGQNLYSAAAGSNRTFTTNEIEEFLNAVRKNNLPVVEDYLKNDMDPNVTDQNEKSALMGAAEGGHLEIVQLLLVKGADFNTRNQLGDTALMLAARNSHVGIVQMLIDAGADFNVISQSKNTPLMEAVEWGYIKIAQLLLAYGADVNFAPKMSLQDGQCESGPRTALQCAIVNRNKRMIELLLKHGANTANHRFAGPKLESIAAVFHALKERDSSSIRLSEKQQNILDAYLAFQQSPRQSQRLNQALGVSSYVAEEVMGMQRAKSGHSAHFRPYDARILAMLDDRAPRSDLEAVFEPECIAQLIYYLITGEFADTREQLKDF